MQREFGAIGAADLAAPYAGVDPLLRKSKAGKVPHVFGKGIEAFYDIFFCIAERPHLFRRRGIFFRGRRKRSEYIVKGAFFKAEQFCLRFHI